ncbi:sugar phosphate isomerase/epimerase [Candidatus Poribacteria bacterium]|nr:sugar phosphate isomerase/epimerase [Candidatus Poribacteria bacterium]
MKPEKPMEIGIMLGVGDDPAESLEKVKAVGVTNAQMGCPPEEYLGGTRFEELRDAIRESGITITTVFCGFAGESYADIPTVQRTVGYVPADTREERVQKTFAVSEFAKGLGVDAVAAHIGFVPEDTKDPAYKEILATIQRIADYCAVNGQVFSLETGQEPAETLLGFLKDLKRANVRVNFDPANMILYGCGEPIEALGVLKDYIASVHAKDGKWSDKPGVTWGVETPLGEGDVGMDRFVAKLKEIGYDGYITIEREISGDKQIEDIRGGVALLRSLVG